MLDTFKEFTLLDLPVGQAVVEGNHDRMRRAMPGHMRWSEMATVCTNFLEGRQWTEEELAILTAERRPHLTKNKISVLYRLMMGFLEENSYEGTFLPGNNATGTQAIAEVLTSVHKAIEEDNEAEWRDKEVFQDGITTGRGFIDQRISFDRNHLGDVKQTTMNPFEVVIDNEAQSYDPNDTDNGWSHFAYHRWMSIADIYTMYGPLAFKQLGDMTRTIPLLDGDYYMNADVYDKPPSGFGGEEDIRIGYEWTNFYSARYADHFLQNRRLIRVIDCQHKILKRCNYFMDVETGQQKVIPDNWDDAKIRKVMQWCMERQLPITVQTGIKRRIRWTISAADRLLWDEWSPYEQYTVIPFFPYFRRGETRGMIEDLIDPQKELNKRSSAFLHIIMATANSGWMYENGSLSEEMEQALEQWGARPGIHIKYNMGYNQPQKIEPSATPTNVKLLEDQASADMREIAGINESSLGMADPTANSGRAILAKQKQAVIGAQPHFSNYSRYRQLKCKNQLYLIQNFYTEERLFRTRTDETAQDQEMVINARNAAGEIVNNVAMGTYTVSIADAPISATFMQAQFEEALQLLEKGVPIPPDILIKLSSVGYKEEIIRRMEEQRMLEEENARVAAIAAKGSLGLPPNLPTPPVVVDGQPPVEVAQPVAPAGFPQASALPAM